MMPARKVTEYVLTEPFKPFRIKMASGQFYDVRHPEMITVGRTTARVFEPGEPDTGKADHWHDLSYVLMETLDPLEPSTA